MQSEVSPTARALLTLELVQNRPGITADRIAERLGVTSRAARRYIAILREAEIPIDSVSGPAGGYRPGRGLRLPPLLFNHAEALGLVMAVLEGRHEATDPGDPVGDALGKILRAMPKSVATQADAVRRATAPAPNRTAVRPDPLKAATLVTACSERRLVRLDYRSEAGSQWSFEAEPWAVVVRYGRWYLLCLSLPAEAVRAFRIDRVQHVEVLHRGFDPPDGLDPVSELEHHLGTGWEFAAEVLIDAPIERLAELVPGPLGRLEPVDAEVTRLLGSTSNPPWYAEQLTRIPAPFRVEGGPEIRAAVRELGERLLGAVSLPDT
jgi:predicted DNA-binding transcriptional regulator YafY